MKDAAKVTLFLVSLGVACVGFIAVGTAEFGDNSSPLTIKAGGSEHTLSVDFSGYDYEIDKVITSTDSGNLIRFAGSGCNYYSDHILIFNSFGNADALSGMTSISIDHTGYPITVDAAFEEGDFLLSTSDSNEGTFEWDFGGYHPAYFRIRSDYAIISAVTVTYSCDRSAVPQSLLDEINELGYELNSDGVSYSVYPLYNTIRQATIPETHEDLPVTKLKYDCWNALQNLTEVNVPSHVTRLSTNQFANCPKLATVTLSEGIQQIDNNAFIGCSSLTRIDIPSTVQSIPYGTSNPFKNCTSLSYIGVDAENDHYESRDGVLYEKTYDGRRLHSFPLGLALETYSVALGTSEIRNNAFQGCNVANVILPDSVTSIGAEAFRGSKIESIDLGDGLENVYSDAFRDCTRLASLTLPSSLREIYENAFSSCSALTSIEIPDSVTYLGYTAFSSCTGLLSATIGNGIETINGQFNNCSSLTTLNLGTGLRTLSLSGCTSLSSIAVAGGNTYLATQNGVLFKSDMSELLLYPAAKADTSYTVPSGVTAIGGGAFHSASNLTSVTLPAGLESIGHECFKGAGITSITLPSSVTSLGMGAFSSCLFLASADLSATSLTALPTGLFYCCFNLASLHLPASVATIAEQAIGGCLTKIDFDGTKEQWGSISLTSGWNQASRTLKSVVCSDGTVTL